MRRSSPSRFPILPAARPRLRRRSLRCLVQQMPRCHGSAFHLLSVNCCGNGRTSVDNVRRPADGVGADSAATRRWRRCRRRSPSLMVVSIWRPHPRTDSADKHSLPDAPPLDLTPLNLDYCPGPAPSPPRRFLPCFSNISTLFKLTPDDHQCSLSYPEWGDPVRNGFVPG